MRRRRKGLTYFFFFWKRVGVHFWPINLFRTDFGWSRLICWHIWIAPRVFLASVTLGDSVFLFGSVGLTHVNTWFIPSACCEDSQTIGLYDHFPVRWPWPSFKVTSASQTWLPFNLWYLGQYLGYYIKTWHDGRLMDAMYNYAHSRFDNLHLNWCKVTVGRQRQNNLLSMLTATKQAISIKLGTTVGHFVLDIDFSNVYMSWPACFSLFCVGIFYHEVLVCLFFCY